MKVHSDKRKRTICIDDKWSETETIEALTHLRSVLNDLKRKSGDSKGDVKIIELDWNNVDEIDRLYRSLQGRRQQLKKETGQLVKITNTDHYQVQWDAIQNILKEDISFLYADKTLNADTKYYIYAHCDTSKPIKVSKKNVYHTLSASFGMNYLPFYIGKGTGDRYKIGDRNRNYSKISSKKYTNIDKIILKDGLTESEALQYESKLIDIFGLAIHKGLLINIDEGNQRDHRRFCYQKELNKLRKIEDNL